MYGKQYGQVVVFIIIRKFTIQYTAIDQVKSEIIGPCTMQTQYKLQHLFGVNQDFCSFL